MTGRLRLPAGRDRTIVGLAALVWLGALAAPVGRALPLLLGLLGLAALAIRSERVSWGVAALGLAATMAGVVSGTAAARAQAATVAAGGPEGPVALALELKTDAEAGRYGVWAVAYPLDPESGARGWPPVLLQGAVPGSLAVGEVVTVRGSARPVGGIARGTAYGWRLTARSVELTGTSSHLLVAANAVRRRVDRALLPHQHSRGAALVRGFLIGDERALPEIDRAAMRAAGLSHFTAVSGSNVALFLAALWVALGPLGLGSRRRAVGGLTGLVLFAAITRWEPSVLRACTMAAIVLGGRAGGIVVSPWSALGVAVGGLVLVSGELAAEAGFQLSVTAAAGVIAGAGFWQARVIGPAMSTAVAAHLAVAPVLLLRFGDIPEWGPALNLAAAPLVAASTVLGAAGTALPIAAMTTAAVRLAEAVLAIAHFGAALPAAGIWALAGLAAALAAIRFTFLRVPAAVVITLALIPATGDRLTPSSVIFFDVGQGDAAAIRTTGGRTVLIDGGPDPVLLDRKLKERGIDTVDLLIVSHSHRDHIDGLEAVVGRRPVTTLWHSDPPDDSGRLARLVAAAQRAGTRIEVPPAGTWVTLDGVALEVLGPIRRYASPNDQSLVVRVTLDGTTVLFTGDVELYAQADLAVPHAQVLKVPHQGAATSDPAWLAGVGASVAVVSVGPNTYGHPSDRILEALTATGADVRRTDRDGDVVISLAPAG